MIGGRASGSWAWVLFWLVLGCLDGTAWLAHGVTDVTLRPIQVESTERQRLVAV